MWTRLTLVTAPAAKVLDLTEVKAHLRVDSDPDGGVDPQDQVIQEAMDAAEASLDGPGGLGIALITQTWRLSLDTWPCDLILPLGPVQSVASVTYVDSAGVTQTLDPSAYRLDTGRKLARLLPAWNTPWPAVRCDAGVIQITFVTGYGPAAANVPAPIRKALKMLVGDAYENRDAQVIDASRATLIVNPSVERLLSRYRVELP